MNSEFDPNLVDSFFNEYQDRGMVKWQGFYLSDHTAKRRQQKKYEVNLANHKHSKQMKIQQIVKTINEAITKNKSVTVELNTRNLDGIIADDVSGHIVGYFNDQLLINNQLINLNDVYAIQITN